MRDHGSGAACRGSRGSPCAIAHVNDDNRGTHSDPLDEVSELRELLDLLLQAGMADEAIDHARQVAMVTSIVSQAFEAEGLRCTLVGGSAIEVYAPGIFKSGDIDLVIEELRGTANRERLDPVFASLGFEKQGRHWRRGDLFIEVPSQFLEDPAEVIRLGHFPLNIVVKEVLLADRTIGFKYWRQTSYGQQAIDMIAAFGNELTIDRLMPRLIQEQAVDAYEALKALSQSNESVNEDTLQALLERLASR
jgi:hypothetical protein